MKTMCTPCMQGVRGTHPGGTEINLEKMLHFLYLKNIYIRKCFLSFEVKELSKPKYRLYTYVNSSNKFTKLNHFLL